MKITNSDIDTDVVNHPNSRHSVKLDSGRIIIIKIPVLIISYIRSNAIYYNYGIFGQPKFSC